MSRAILVLLPLGMVLAACLDLPTPAVVTTATAEPVPTVQPTATAVPSETPERALVTAAEALNVRRTPGTDGAVIGALYAGQVVKTTGVCRDGWAQIRWQGSRAWVNADYLTGELCPG